MASKEKAVRRGSSPARAMQGQKKSGSSKQQQMQTVVAVFPDNTKGNRAFAALEAAAGQLMQTELQRIPFEKLDYGETATLDKFYAANVAVVDVTERHMQAALFYQLGLRENFDMKNNVVTVLESQSTFSEPALGGGNGPAAMARLAGTSYITYSVDSEGHTLSREGGSPLNQAVPLYKTFKHILQDMHTAYRKNHKEMFYKHLRKVREMKEGAELKAELHKLTMWIDEDPKLFTGDIIYSVLLSYRDIQDYDSMISLVDKITGHQEAEKPAVQVQCAFALNRRNKEGDRSRALAMLEKVLSVKENHVPDYLCLCGRIHKDRFVDSEHSDQDALQNAIHWYREGFKVQPNEYAGINLATLLVISGQEFETCQELHDIGSTLNYLIGKKGSLQSQSDYWIVATFFEVSILARDYTRACEAALCMFKLKPPLW
ncbi:Mitogen-activated protein kinase kinase kinase 15 [Geodia barretti]|nr:Mitogen-activated protein kinase kinase kinase 15 [Geodia barretti]